MQKSFVKTSDPGHGWLEVTTEDIADVGLALEDFSSFSYRRGNTCFLEEDCDAPLFQNAYKSKYWCFPEVGHKYEEYTRIRDYSPIR